MVFTLSYTVNDKITFRNTFIFLINKCGVEKELN